MRRALIFVVVGSVSVLLGTGPAAACAGLLSPNGTVSLVRTTTLAAYHGGVEHYVTSFAFAGGGGEFGSIVPLPGVPAKVEKGGDWTLQRLTRETQPVTEDFSLQRKSLSATAAPAEVIQRTTIDALDVTILKGGGQAVGTWAKEHGFTLTPDSPEVLDFYASRSPIFMATRFDADAARRRGQAIGDGTPVHITIPTTNPWVPLRILGLGHRKGEPVQADVYLLTDRRPTILPAPRGRGVELQRQEPASEGLLADLRSDRGMEWVPSSMWLSYLRLDTTADRIDYDLAVDASGQGQPSRLAAGLDLRAAASRSGPWAAVLTVAGLMALVTAGALARRRPATVRV